MRKNTTEFTGEYYDNLDAFIDMRASGIELSIDEAELKRMIHYTNAAI